MLVDVALFPMALLVGRIWQHCLHSAAIPPYGPGLSQRQGQGQCEGFGKQERKTNITNAMRRGLHIYDDYIAVEFRLRLDFCIRLEEISSTSHLDVLLSCPFRHTPLLGKKNLSSEEGIAIR